MTLSGLNSHAQTRQELEGQRRNLEREIQTNSSQLQNIKKDKNSKLEQYVGIKAQVDRRKKLLSTFEQEISLLDNQLINSQNSIDSLTLINQKMKRQYGLLLQSAYRMKTNESSWQFIFSASSFNDAYKRWQYLHQYKSAIKQQAVLAKAAQTRINQKQDEIEKQRNSKVELLSTQKDHFQEVEKELKQTNQLINKLSKNERRIAANLANQKKAFSQLNTAIESSIQREIDRQSKALPAQDVVEKEKTVITAQGFSKNKGKLPWPVTGGKIVSSFGKHPHPKIKSVQIVNNGVDIKAKKRAAVMNVYDGTIVSTQVVPGYKNTVIIRHADYYTVYSNMESIHVKRGAQIIRGEKIGRLGNDANLHFEIWHNKDRVNPVHWIK